MVIAKDYLRHGYRKRLLSLRDMGIAMKSFDICIANKTMIFLIYLYRDMGIAMKFFRYLYRE